MPLLKPARQQTRPTARANTVSSASYGPFGDGRSCWAAHVAVLRLTCSRQFTGDRTLAHLKRHRSNRHKLNVDDMRSTQAKTWSAYPFDSRFRGWIYERPIGQRLHPRRELCRVNLIVSHDVHHRNSLRQEVVSNDPTMAAPPHGFSTHNRAAIVMGERPQFIQSRSERVSCRVIGIVPEGRDLPERVGRWHRSFFAVPQPAKSRQLSIGYSSANERCRESISVELRICSRARDRSHVDEHVHRDLLEQSHKLDERKRSF